MTKHEIFISFECLFPDYAKKVKSFRKVGSKAIELLMDDGTNRYFMYYDVGNWNFGTKPWRQRPEDLPKKKK